MIIFYGLLIYTFAVYGISWLITQSHAFEWLREGLRKIAEKTNSIIFSKLNYLSECIVCTSVWVGSLLAIFSENSALMLEVFPPVHLLDVLIWAGWSASTTWALANLLGDTD